MGKGQSKRRKQRQSCREPLHLRSRREGSVAGKGAEGKGGFGSGRPHTAGLRIGMIHISSFDPQTALPDLYDLSCLRDKETETPCQGMICPESRPAKGGVRIGTQISEGSKACVLPLSPGSQEKRKRHKRRRGQWPGASNSIERST